MMFNLAAQFAATCVAFARSCCVGANECALSFGGMFRNIFSIRNWSYEALIRLSSTLTFSLQSGR